MAMAAVLFSALVGAIPIGLIYLDPTDNFLTPLFSDAGVIITQDKHLIFSGLFLFLPFAFFFFIARLNPFQKLSSKKADQTWRNWRWALHKVTEVALLSSYCGAGFVMVLGLVSQPIIMNARGYNLCWSVKIPSTFNATKQAYAKSGIKCPDKPLLDKWGYWRE
jgi:hypothetical protein